MRITPAARVARADTLLPVPIDLLAQPADVLRALRTVMGGSRMEPVAEVVRRLRATGLRLPAGSDAEEMVLDVVDSSASLWALGPDLEVLNLAQVMSGRVLTHRLSTAEVADGILQVSIDFPGYAFEHLATSGLTMPTGQVLDLFDRPGGPLDAPLAFTLPEGSYDELGLGVGALAGIAFDAGVARLVAVGDVGDPGALAQDLAAAVADARIVEITEPFELLLATTEHFREPLAPVTEILAECGFGRDGEFIAATPQVLAEDELADQREGVARAFDLGPDEAAVVVGAVWYARALQTALNAQVQRRMSAMATPTPSRAWSVIGWRPCRPRWLSLRSGCSRSVMGLRIRGWRSRSVTRRCPATNPARTASGCCARRSPSPSRRPQGRATGPAWST
jgi:hypothetical protein